MKKKIFFSIIFALFLTIGTIEAASPKQRIYDFADLLSATEIEELESKAEKYSKKRETDFIILTTYDTSEKDVVEYTQDFYDDNELGFDRSNGNAAILTIDMRNREVYLAGFYKGEKYLSDYRLDLIRDSITSDLGEGNYYDAFYGFMKLGYRYMGMNPNADPNSIFFNLRFQIIVSLGIAGLVVGSMAYNRGGRVTVNEGVYRDFSSSRVINRRDNFLRTSVTKTKKPTNKSKSSGGGFSGGGFGGGGTTSGGHSHSGSRGKF